MSLKCISCSVSLISEEKFSKFHCFNCGEEVIVRCRRCRAASKPYKCPKCGFEGP